MTKFVHRVRRDLTEITERAPVSPSARDSILARAGSSIDHSEREVVMLEKNTYTNPRRTWGIPIVVGIAAVAALAVAGIVVMRGDGDDPEQVATADPAPTTVDDEATGTAEPSEAPVADEPAEPTISDDEAAVADEPTPADPAVVADETAPGTSVAAEAPIVDPLEQLVSLPWVSAGDAYATPQEAVHAFLDFMTDHSVLPDSVLYHELTLGDLVETGEGVGEITVTGTEESFHEPGQFRMPTSAIALREVDGSWWVTGATSDTIDVDKPASEGVFAPPMAVSGENGLFSNALQLHVYVDGTAEPLATTYFTGGGVFAWGEFDMTFDPANPEPCVVDRCWDTPDWEVPVGERGTLVITDNTRVVTIPVTFGE